MKLEDGTCDHGMPDAGWHWRPRRAKFVACQLRWKPSEMRGPKCDPDKDSSSLLSRCLFLAWCVCLRLFGCYSSLTLSFNCPSIVVYGMLVSAHCKCETEFCEAIEHRALVHDVAQNSVINYPSVRTG